MIAKIQDLATCSNLSPIWARGIQKFQENGLYHDVIFRLCSDLKGSNVKLYFDNLYCSLSVLQDLQKDNIWATGTIRGNRIGLHPTVKKPPKMVRGEHKMFQDKKNPNLTCCNMAGYKTSKICFSSM